MPCVAERLLPRPFLPPTLKRLPRLPGLSAQICVQSHRPRIFLFAQVLEGDLNALVVEFLIVATELVAAVGGAMEELADRSDRRMRLSLELGRAADVDSAIEVDVVDVMVDLTHQQARHGL